VAKLSVTFIQCSVLVFPVYVKQPTSIRVKWFNINSPAANVNRNDDHTVMRSYTLYSGVEHDVLVDGV